ncbi:MAG: recombinase family protein [Spirochaetes bacterium]|nr:recombinase family protein [Spirochaetota bacterium]
MIAAYIRVSSKQMQGDGESTPSQIAAAEAYAKSIGEDVSLYQDKLSGSRPDRKDYTRLKQDIIQGKVQKVYCRDEKRIGRNAIESLSFFALLIEHKVTLIVSGISKDLANYTEPKKSDSLGGLNKVDDPFL